MRVSSAPLHASFLRTCHVVFEKELVDNDCSGVGAVGNSRGVCEGGRLASRERRGGSVLGAYKRSCPRQRVAGGGRQEGSPRQLAA